MEDNNLLSLFVKSIFVDNMIFAYFLGMCSYLAVSKNVKTAFGLGIAVIFVLLITLPVNYLLENFLLKSGAIAADIDLSFLSFILFIAVIAAIVQLVEMIVERFTPSLYASLGIFLPLIAVNCAIIGASLIMQQREFDIQYQVPEGYKVVFDVYAENPYNVTPEGFSKKKDVKPIISAMTDENGRYHISRVISSGVKEVYVASDVAGVPALMHGTIQGNNVAPVEFDMSSLIDEEEMTSRAVWNAMFLGGWNYWGRPNYIDTSKDCPISKRDLRAISAALPEWKTVNSNYTNENYIYVQKEAEVWISLLSEKSLFNNVLGYYCYT